MSRKDAVSALRVTGYFVAVGAFWLAFVYLFVPRLAGPVSAGAGIRLLADLGFIAVAALFLGAVLVGRSRDSGDPERRALAADIQQLAYYDSLTGLANRRLLRERAQQAMALARRQRRPVGLLYLDLDRFRTINDTLGHDAGDDLLVQVGKRLLAETRESDTLSRLGADEFAVLLTAMREEEDASIVARRILNLLGEPFSVRGQRIHVDVSVGIALFPQDGAAFDDVLKSADIAMYRAKADRSGFQFYRPELSAHARERLLLEEELRQAVGENRLSVHVQPVLCLAKRQVVGAEVLTRWIRPRHGEVPPARFIPLAEETGLIVSLDQRALVWGGRFAAAATEDGWDGWVAINLSPLTLGHARLVTAVDGVVTRTGIDPKRFVFEITESAAMRDPEATADILEQLKLLGVRLAMDDFGMGYSSLAYLKRFPVDFIKIDKDFVAGIGTNSKDEHLIEAVMTMARGLGVEVIAEGVEKPAQLQWLMDHGCDLVQGFLIGAPTAPDEFAFDDDQVNTMIAAAGGTGTVRRDRA